MDSFSGVLVDSFSGVFVDSFSGVFVDSGIPECSWTLCTEKLGTGRTNSLNQSKHDTPKEAAMFDREGDVDKQALTLSADTPSTRVRVQVVRAISQHTR